MKKTLKDFDFNGKTVLVRADFNVPLKGEKIENDNRIQMTIPTIKYLLDHNAKIILMSHLGRPKGEYKKEYSLKPVAVRLGEILNTEIKFFENEKIVSEKVKEAASKLQNKEILLLENLRFEKGEEKNDEEFAKELASLADIFVNDAFGTAHRAHASNVGVCKLLPSCSGLLVEKEIEYLSEVLENPQRPFISILGGSKVSDKIGVIENLLNKVDEIIIIGAMAFTFLKAQGKNVGKSLVEDDKLDLAKNLLDKAIQKGVKILLPVDVVQATELSEEAKGEIVDVDNISSDKMGLDIGTKSIDNIKEDLKKAKTVVWNGPAGVFEIDQFANGTLEIAKTLALSDATVIIGGGDSASAVEKANVSDKITHISTGGGASLEMLEGKVLPGIEALEDK